MSDTYSISNLADLNKILECQIIIGDVEIHNYTEPLIVLDNLEHIDGSLTIRDSPSLIRLEAQKLQNITHTYHLEKLTSLALITMPALVSAKHIQWTVLPLLGHIHFGHLEDMHSITISDTSLTGFSGLSSHTMLNLDINNNRFMEFILSDVQYITGSLHVAGNANVQLELPQLKLTHNISIHNVDLLRLDSLDEVKGSVSIIENYFADLTLPKLKKVEGSFSLAQNANLAKASFGSVTEIGGGLVIANNTNLHHINFFPNLTMIGGALELMGDIHDDEWKSLKLVKGSARMVTTDPSFDCVSWSKKEISSVVRGGKVKCLISGGTATSPESHQFLKPTSESNRAVAGWVVAIVCFFVSLCFYR